MKSRSSRLTGNRLEIKSVKYIRKAVMLCAGVTAAGLLFLGTQAQAAGDRAIPQPGRDPLYECGRAGNHS